MISRLMNCIILAKNPLNSQLSRTILRGIRQTPMNSQSVISSYNFLLSRKGFCSSAVGKLTNEGDSDNPSEPSPSSLISTEDKNDNESDEVIPEELKAAMEADPTLLKRFKILQLEMDVLRHTGKLVPSEMKPLHWFQLLKEPTRTSRRKYLQFLFLVEKKRENHKKKQQAARIEHEIQRETSPVEDNEYRLHKIAMFMRIYDTTMNHFYHSRLVQAMQFGEKLIIDCGYHAQLTARESTECVKQLAYMFGENRVSRDPFDLHFCNVDKSSLMMQKLHKRIPTMYDPAFPLNISEKSYLESFDKDKLVYLTPDCNTEMEKYDPDSIYIIGAIVDKSNNDPLSLARAKKDGIRMVKLPLEKYLLWNAGASKRLPLNQIVNILTDLRITGDWKEALKHIPKRKLARSVSDFNTNSNPADKRIQQHYDRFNDGPFRRHKPEIRSSFTFRDRQRTAFKKY